MISWPCGQPAVCIGLGEEFGILIWWGGSGGGSEVYAGPALVVTLLQSDGLACGGEDTGKEPDGALGCGIGGMRVICITLLEVPTGLNWVDSTGCRLLP